MKLMKRGYLFTSLALLASVCSCVFVVDDKDGGDLSSSDSASAFYGPDTVRDSAANAADTVAADSLIGNFLKGKQIDTKNVKPSEVVAFAKTLIGVPYKYASTDPAVGFDCSGFITYVFHHFGIVVPRSSIDFTPVGKEVPTDAAVAGDLILFTGTDSTERFVGHMGLVVSNDQGVLQFIHSTSGKKNGVTITPLNGYYKSRYMKTIRIFPDGSGA
jgi:cell wall-associated NlpC family hydrolase